MIQISIYDNSGDMPKIVSDQRLGEAPESILKRRQTLALNRKSNAICGLSGTGYAHYYREWTRKAGDFQVIIHKLDD